MQTFVFTLCGVQFGFPLKNLESVEGSLNNMVNPATAAGYIKGTVTVRNQIVPVYDLPRRFGYADKKLNYIVVVSVDGMRLGFPVEGINEVIEVKEEENISTPLVISSKQQYFKSIAVQGSKWLILLDVDHLLQEKEKLEIRRLTEVKTETEAVE